MGALAPSSPFYSQRSSPKPLPQPPSPCSSASSVRPPLVPPAVGGISSPRPELPVGLSVCVSIVVSCPLAPWVQGLRFWPRAGVCWVPVWAEPRGGESVRGSSVQSVCWGSWAPPSPRVRLPGFSQRLQMITNSVRPQENSGLWDGKLIFFHFNQHFHDNSL